ncbi:YihY/virulence factor BrkB family protein, partial [Candidatus Calescamantes bacterium]|nr:YihY/virulence factor BrkB family protein [Candidatus Calescamantes bacterium]
IGVIFAFLIAVRIISLVERIFNEIWGVKEGRAWWKKMSEYITLIIVTPIFLSGAITLTITLQHTSFFQRFFSSMTTNRHFLIFTSYFSAWLIFSFLYFFLPNTRVRIKSAFLAGVIGGSLWQLAQWGYFHYQVGFTRYNAIYGSFAQVLLFLIWMQVSWAILLLGGEISYVHQNLKILEKEIRFRNLSFSDKEILSLAILADLGKKYAEGKEWSPEEWELSAKVPLRPINQLLSLLEEKGFVKKSEKGQFLPARPYEHIPVKEVIDSLREEGDSIPINEGLHYLQELQKNYLQKGWEKFSSLTLKDILDG